jgi:putative ABC transport system permease protein
MVLLTLFAGVALVLAAIGLYGVMSYGVSQRTREIGVRIALGAQRADVRRMIVVQGMTLAMSGALLGFAASAALARVLSSLLFGIAAIDPLTFVLVPAVLLASAFVASYLPARRATNVEALVALREN